MMATGTRKGRNAADKESTYPPGAWIFSEGEPSDAAYEVLAGQVEVLREGAEGPIRLNLLGPGTLFGEMGLIDGQPRSASTRAQGGPVVLRRLEREAFFHRLAEDQGFARPVLAQLAKQLRRTTDTLSHHRSTAIEAAKKAQSLEAQRTRRRRGPRLIGPGGWFSPDPDPEHYHPDRIALGEGRNPPLLWAGLGVLGLFFVAVLLFLFFARVETIVTAQGRLTPTVPNFAVAPLETAIISALKAQEGERVAKGQVLATLDATFAEADEGASRAALVNLEARIHRLEAELSGETEPGPFSDQEREARLQREIWQRRRQQITAELAGHAGRLKEIEAEAETIENSLASLKAQIAGLGDIVSMRKRLLDKGAGSRLKYLIARYDQLRTEREERRSSQHLKVLAHRRTAEQAAAKAVVAGFRAEAGRTLAALQRERASLVERLARSEQRRRFVTLRAPAEAIILEAADLSVGSVIEAAQPLFTLVPVNVPLEVVLDVAPEDVGRIKHGDLVRLKLDSLPFQKHGMIYGAIRVIAGDSVEEQQGGETRSYYETRVDLGERRLRAIPPAFRLQPGMTVVGDIRTGERRILSLLLDPVTEALATSFREP